MLAANRWGVCGLPQAIDKHVKIGSLSCLCLEDRAAGSQARFYADAEGMNADARGWARVRHGAARLNPADPDEQYWRVGPCPIRVHRRPSGCICVRRLLASLRAAPTCKVARSLPPSQHQLHRVTRVETAGLTGSDVFRRRHPVSSGPVSPVPRSCRRAPCGARPKAHAPIRRGAAMAGRSCRTRRKRSAPGGRTPVGLSRGGKSPCTRTGRRGGQQSSPPDASLRQAGHRRSGRQASKKMEPQMHADVRRWAGVRHARSEPNPTGSAW